MMPLVRISAAVALCSLFSSAVVAAPPASFAACAACHSTDGAAGLGPTLKGVVGHKAGSQTGFTFSRAMRNSNVTWDEKSLDAFLADPQKVIAGNTMPFPGVPDAKERAEIVEYLKTIK